MPYFCYISKALLRRKLDSSDLFRRVMFLIILGTLYTHQAAYACPNCKDNFDLNGAQGGIGAAYGYTIYLMILLPIAIVATIVIKVKRQMDANDKAEFYRQIGEGADNNMRSLPQ